MGAVTAGDALPRPQELEDSVDSVPTELPKFGVDLDGCVFAFDIGACIALKLRGVDIEIRESYSWNDIQQRIAPADWRWLWTEGVRHAFQAAPVYPGAARALRSIQERMDLIVITHRPRAVADITLAKLAQLRLRPTAVLHVQGQDKSVIQPDCVAYVEDRSENILDLASHGVPVFVPRKPWNRDIWSAAGQAANRLVGYDVRPYDQWKEISEWALAYK